MADAEQQPALQGWPVWHSCGDIRDCTNCTTGITGCHWCADEAKPAGGSCNLLMTGCWKGATCASPVDCIRTDAEFKGYAAPPAKAVGVFIVIALVLMAAFVCCLWCCFAVWDKRRLAALRTRVEARRAQASAGNVNAAPERGLQLSSLPVSSAFRGSSSSSSVLSGDASVSSAIPGARVSVSTKSTRTRAGGGNADLRENLLEQKDASDNEVASSGHARRYAVRLNEQGQPEVMLVDPHVTAARSPEAAFVERAAGAPIPFPPPLPPLGRKEALLRSCAKCGTVAALVGVFIALLVACLMFPSMPRYSMCDKDIQWYSILNNVQNFQAGVDVDLHVAVWNPNRWTLRLKRVDARILYHNDIVGRGSQSDLSFHSGSINDFILTVLFNPSLRSAGNMLRDHLAGQLLLDVLFDIDAAVLIGNFKNPALALNTSYVMEDIDAEGEASREYCKCQDPDVNAQRTTTSGLAAVLADSLALVPRIGSKVQPQVVLRPRINVRTTFTTQQDEEITLPQGNTQP